MKIWMFQSKRNFVICFTILLIIVPLLFTSMFCILENNDQTFDEFKEKSINEYKIINNQKSNYFIDTNGYIPEWAKNIGEEQALGKCMNIFSDYMYKVSSSDYKWCNEFSGFLGDKISQEMKDMGLK